MKPNPAYDMLHQDYQKEGTRTEEFSHNIGQINRIKKTSRLFLTRVLLSLHHILVCIKKTTAVECCQGINMVNNKKKRETIFLIAKVGRLNVNAGIG